MKKSLLLLILGLVLIFTSCSDSNTWLYGDWYADKFGKNSAMIITFNEDKSVRTTNWLSFSGTYTVDGDTVTATFGNGLEGTFVFIKDQTKEIDSISIDGKGKTSFYKKDDYEKMKEAEKKLADELLPKIQGEWTYSVGFSKSIMITDHKLEYESPFDRGKYDMVYARKIDIDNELYEIEGYDLSSHFILTLEIEGNEIKIKPFQHKEYFIKTEQ